MPKDTNSKPWQVYEDTAYDLFRSTGYPCRRNIVMQGSRGTHQIDIVVDLTVLVGNHKWIIECKNWSRPVGKRELMAFKTVIDDLGADHGYLLSESGFQKGAREMAHTFNISLCSLSELQKHFVKEQLLPQHQQSKQFTVIIEHEEDTGNMDSETILTLVPINNLTVLEYLIEIHVISEVVPNCILSSDKIKRIITPEGTIRFSLPWDLMSLCGLELETIPMNGGGVFVTGNNKAGTRLDGAYRVVFRTLTGPVGVNTCVPMFK